MKPPPIQYRRDLHRLFAGLHPDEIGGLAEIGVAEGNFSEDMLRWPVAFNRIYLVDRWKSCPEVRGDSASPQSWHDMNLARVRERTKEFGDRCQVLRGESTTIAMTIPNESLSLVYVDADHSYHGVHRDMNAWVQKIKMGGYIAFHDFENPAYGVKAAVTEFCETHNVDSLRLMAEDKPEDAGAYFQINERFIC